MHDHAVRFRAAVGRYRVRRRYEVETRTRWDGPRLVTETKTDGGMKITETYQRADDQHELWVTLRLEGGRLGEAVNVRRVYDAITSE